MKLTEREKEICKQYSAKDADGFVHCDTCPLNINSYELKCYATIDGRTSEARSLERL